MLLAVLLLLVVTDVLILVHELGHLIAAKIQPIPGVLNTITCLVVEP